MRPRIGLSDLPDEIGKRGHTLPVARCSLVALLLAASMTFAGDAAVQPVHRKGMSDGPDPIGTTSVTVLKPGTRAKLGDIVFVRVGSIAEARDVLDRSAVVDGVTIDGAVISLFGKCNDTNDCDRAVSDVCRELYGDGRTRGTCTVQQEADGSGSCQKQCEDGHVVVIVCSVAPLRPSDLRRIIIDSADPLAR